MLYFRVYENVNKVFPDLERVEVRIAKAKFQFYGTDIEIIRYICNVNGHHSNTFKVWKILNWPKYTNVIAAYVFIEVCIYYHV